MILWYLALESWRRTGGYQLAGFAAGIAKLMRLTTLEIIGIALAQDSRLLTHRDFETTAQDNAAFFSLMGNRVLACASPGLISLIDELNSPIRNVCTNLSERHTAVRYLSQLLSAKKYPILMFELIAKKLAETNRDSVQYLFQHTDGWIQLARFNLGNSGIRNTGLPCQLTLRQIEPCPNTL